MPETERRAKSKVKEQLSFFREAWMLIVGMIGVAGAIASALILYGLIYPAIEEKITKYHVGFTQEDAIALKIDIKYMTR